MISGAKRVKNASTKPKSKFGIDHWYSAISHPFTNRDGKKLVSPNWMATFCHEGHRESLGLQTDNKAAAADIALQAFIFLKANGWEKWHAEYKPAKQEPVVKQTVATVAQFLEKVQPLIVCDRKTFQQYGQSLRRVAAEIAGVGRRGEIGHYAWREQVGAITLDVFTEAAVNNWQIMRLKKAGTSPLKKLQTGTSINSTIRMAKALFAKNVLKKLKGVLVLPDFVPFADCERQKHSDTTFKPKFKISDLANSAATELKGTDLEAYKVFVLALIFGMRRNEIDKIEWSSFLPDAGKFGVIRIETTDYLSAKTKDSCASLPISDASVKKLLSEWEAKRTGSFIIESDQQLKLDLLYYDLRCGKIFARLNKWLRSKGVANNKPLHALRKSYGSILNNEFGIHAAKVGLRHSNIQTTCAYYVSETPVGLPNAGLLLNGAPTNVIELEQTA